MLSVKFVSSVAAVLVILACSAEARHRTYRPQYNQDDDDFEVSAVAGRRPHPDAQRSLSPKQGRVFPGALAIKKLVLLKFKKIIPISLILLKSSNENEAELVPVYPTSEIPANVQFIPTPNGISGHKDVQAIAIPSELHQQLEMNGLANLESIEALLSDAEEETSEENSNTVVVEQTQKDEELLNKKEDDEDQLLDSIIAEKPTKLATGSTLSGLRRFAADDIVRSGLKSPHHTTVEEIPLFLYSAKDTPQVIYNARKSVRHQNTGRRHHA